MFGLTWTKKIRWIVIGLAVLWGYTGSKEGGSIFSHRSATPVVPQQFSGCNGTELYKNFSCQKTCRHQASASAFRSYSEQTLGRTQSCHGCKAWDGGDALLDAVLKMHDGLSFDSVLDGSSSSSSLDWISRELRPKKWTAVVQHANEVAGASAKRRTDTNDTVLLSSWRSDAFLDDEKFDLMLLDQLMPALEHLWPHHQEDIFDRLAPRLAADGRMYVVGQDPEPFPSRFKFPGKSGYHQYHAAHVLQSVNSLVAACITHAMSVPERAVPLDWVVSAVGRSEHLQVDSVQAFPSVWGPKAMHTKLDLCEAKMDGVEGRHLVNGLRDRIKVMRERIDQHPQLASNGVCYGVDYLVVIKQKQRV